MSDDEDLNFEGKITNKDVRELMHIAVIIRKSINNNQKKEEENNE